MFPRLSIPVFIALMSTSAFASCPTAADLDGAGIQFKLDDGATETFTRLGPNEIRAVFQDPPETGNNGTLLQLAQGFYVLSFTDVTDGVADTTPGGTSRYTQPNAALPQVLSSQSWSLQVEMTLGGGMVLETHSFTSGAETQVSFGPCRYRMIPVTLEYGSSDLQDTIHYYPDLGISYLAQFRGENAVMDFNYVAIARGQ